MKRRIGNLALALSLGGCAEPRDASVCDDASRASADAVVVIEVMDEPICLGSVIDDAWIVTAKHCVQIAGAEAPVDADLVRVRAAGGSARTIASIDVPGGAYESLGQLSGQDIALLRLASESESSSLAPADEPPAQDETTCAVLADDVAAPVSIRVRAVESMAIYADGVTCPGDSGGPLLALDGSLLGIASWRSLGECGTGTSVFTRVDAHREWIDETISR